MIKKKLPAKKIQPKPATRKVAIKKIKPKVEEELDEVEEIDEDSEVEIDEELDNEVDEMEEESEDEIDDSDEEMEVEEEVDDEVEEEVEEEPEEEVVPVAKTKVKVNKTAPKTKPKSAKTKQQPKSTAKSTKPTVSPKKSKSQTKARKSLYGNKINIVSEGKTLRSSFVKMIKRNILEMDPRLSPTEITNEFATNVILAYEAALMEIIENESSVNIAGGWIKYQNIPAKVYDGKKTLKILNKTGNSDDILVPAFKRVRWSIPVHKGDNIYGKIVSMPTEDEPGHFRVKGSKEIIDF